ncbi:MAG: hypothetical protein JRG94_20705 [Deltaproteobacteria bacterium]|nr:hypothetical protein [Deltaproteobacteria bacterium]
MKPFLALVLVVSCGVVAGCATIDIGPYQEVEITSDPSGATVRLEPAGMEVTTPAVVKLGRRSEQEVLFELDGFRPETKHLYARLSGQGGVMGGLVGLIDDISGATWELAPAPLHAELITLEAAAAEPPKPVEEGVIFLNFTQTYSLSPSSLFIGLDVDGERLAVLAPLEFIKVDLSPGKHNIVVVNNNSFSSDKSYRFTVHEGLMYVSLITEFGSTRATKVNGVPRGFPDVFTEVDRCTGTEECEIAGAYKSRRTE